MVANIYDFDLFRRRLETLLHEQNLNREGLANKMGVSKNTVDNIWKKGRKMFPYADDLHRMAKALNVSMDYLSTGQEERSKITDPDVRQIVSELEILKRIDSYQAESMAEQIHALLLVKTGKISQNDAQKGESGSVATA